MFSIKRLAAAIALAAVAGSAAAALPSDVVLIVYDPVTTQTYIRDLGVTTATLTDAALAAPLATGDANWTAFFKAADASQLKWSILGSDSTTGAANGNSFISSVLVGPVTPVTAGLAADAVAYGGIASIVGATFSAGASFINTITTSGADFNVIAQDANGRFAATQTGFGSLGVVKATQGRGAAVTVANFTNLINLDATGAVTLGTVAATPAVPEPGTWALMVAGLLTVGAIARRRAV